MTQPNPPYIDPQLQNIATMHLNAVGSANFKLTGFDRATPVFLALEQLKSQNLLPNDVLVVTTKSRLPFWKQKHHDLSRVGITTLSLGEYFTNSLPTHNINICSYERIRAIQEKVGVPTFSVAVLDEAQAIRNPHARQSQACYQIADNTAKRIALTSVPIIKSPLDIFWIIRFVDKSIFGTNPNSFQFDWSKLQGIIVR